MAFDRMYNPYAQRARIGQNGADPTLANGNGPYNGNGMNGLNNGNGLNGLNNGNGMNRAMAFRQNFRRNDGDCEEVMVCKPGQPEIELCPVVDVCPPAGPTCITVEKSKCVPPCEIKLIRFRPDCPMIVEDYWVSKSVKCFEIVDARIGCVSLTTGDNISGRDLLRDSDDDGRRRGRRRHHRDHCNIVRGIHISQQHPLLMKVFNTNDDESEEFWMKLFGRILAGW